MRATRAARRRGRSGAGTRGGARWLAAVTVSTVLAIASSGIAWVGAAGAAPAANAQKDYPEVDLSKLVLHEVPAGTPQTSATVATNSNDPLVQGRALVPGYVEKEFLVRGDASTYSGPVTGPVEVAQTNVSYSTRVLVRYPKEASKFSGRVVVEPFNTSNNGTDLDAVWSLIAPMLQKRGDAWVGVTERTSAGEALKQADPTRYAEINVPSNDVAWDVLAQVGAAIRKGGSQSPLQGLDAKHLYMAGYSQSGVDVAAFAMALAKRYGTPAGKPVYDGYFPAAHAASVTPLKAGTSVIPKFETPVMTAVGVPVVNLEDQSGVEGFSAELPASAQATLGQKEYTNVSSASVRRADSDQPGDQYRLYEVAGMPHAPGGDGCEGPASSFPVAAVTRGTFALLNRWVETGQKAPRAPRIKMAEINTVSKVAVDQNGNAIGGIRSPYLDDALVRYDVHAPGEITCELAGHEAPLDSAALAKKYTSVDAYMKQFTKGLDAMIKAGYIAPLDRAQLIADQKEKAKQVLGQ
jgi:Alpha/beta hydrolase domain